MSGITTVSQLSVYASFFNDNSQTVGAGASLLISNTLLNYGNGITQTGNLFNINYSGNYRVHFSSIATGGAYLLGININNSLVAGSSISLPNSLVNTQLSREIIINIVAGGQIQIVAPNGITCQDSTLIIEKLS